MELVMPFYSIEYYPGEGFFGFNVNLPQNFPEVASKLEINRKGIENKAKLAWKAHGFSTRDHINLFCDWEFGGLLNVVTVPGNASSLVLNAYGTHFPRYVPHNFDSPKQTSIALAVITHYLSIVQNKFYEQDLDLVERIDQNV